jgi:hypothetical protein
MKRTTRSTSLLALAAVALAGCGVQSRDRQPGFASIKDGMDKWTGDDWTSEAPLPFSFSNVMYLQGPVMDQSNPNVYVIWYGDWSQSGAAQRVVLGFIKDVSGSPYWGIPHGWKATPQNTLGYDVGVALPGRVSTGLRYGGSYADHYSRGSVLTEADVGAIVDDAISNNVLNLANADDPNSIWLVLPSPDVGDTSGFCGYHSLLFPFLDGGVGAAKYAFVATREVAAGSCAPANRSVSPNGSPVGDGMVNVLAHELAETLTDPNPVFEAWSSLNGPGTNEIADKCNFRFGPVYTTANGALANMKLGGHDYLVQELLVPTSPQTCAKVAPADSP